jgi:GxxExxY protein
MKHEDPTQQIIKAFYTVYNTLGYGFLEKVYENALQIELGKMGLKVITQQPINVYVYL